MRPLGQIFALLAGALTACGARYPPDALPIPGWGPADAGAVCVPGLTSHFADINANVFQVSCGTQTSACHSAAGGQFSGGLVLASDAYLNLLGDGGGARAENIAGDVRSILRVKPGDPSNSLLAIKLGLTASSDPHYGSGMPLDSPGSVCPETLAVIVAWIDGGAPND
jgi:hypothetical protein